MLGHGAGIGYTGPGPRMGPTGNFSLVTGSRALCPTGCTSVCMCACVCRRTFNGNTTRLSRIYECCHGYKRTREDEHGCTQRECTTAQLNAAGFVVCKKVSKKVRAFKPPPPSECQCTRWRFLASAVVRNETTRYALSRWKSCQMLHNRSYLRRLEVGEGE